MFLRRAHSTTARVILVGITAGAAASWVKSLAEPRLQELGERIWPPTTEQKSLPGGDVTDRPERMPPAILIRRVAGRVLGRDIDENRSTELMPAIHYGFGIGFGVAHSLVARRRPEVTTGLGIPAGVALWLATHGSVVPAMGLQAAPTAMARSWYVWELGSHLVFGAALEAVRRIGT